MSDDAGRGDATPRANDWRPLLEGVLRSMSASKVKVLAALLLGVSVLAAGAGVLAHQVGTAPQPGARPVPGAGPAAQPVARPKPGRIYFFRGVQFTSVRPDGAKEQQLPRP